MGFLDKLFGEGSNSPDSDPGKTPKGRGAMSKQDRAEMYQKFLGEEGYAPKIDNEGDVMFKYEGGVYLIIMDENDEEFFRLVYPGFWSIESELEREKAQRAALTATAQTKVAKVFLVRDNTWASIEMFCSPPEVFRTVFHRSLRALRAAVGAFQAEMRQ